MPNLILGFEGGGGGGGGPGIIVDVVLRTTTNLTIYVRTAGNDSNDGLTEGNALLTIQAALAKVPSHVEHTVFIDIGAGTFDGFDVSGFVILGGGSLTLQGTLGAPTLTTGTTTGTATGGATTKCIDSGQSWTTNELRGMLMLVDGEYVVISYNTGIQAEFSSYLSASPSGKAYSILEPKTIINTTSSYGSARVTVRGVQAGSDTGWKIKNLCTTSGDPFGIYVYGSDGGVIENTQHLGASSANIYLLYVTRVLTLTNVYCTLGAYGLYTYGVNEIKSIQGAFFDHVNTGMYFSSTRAVYGVAVTVESNGSHGIYGDKCTMLVFDRVVALFNGDNGCFFDHVSWVKINAGSITNSAEYALYVDDTTISFEGTVLNMINNTLGGIIAKNQSVVALTDIGGTGNGGYGLELQSGSRATVTSATDITGSSGDATIDGGTTALTWAGDFENDGDTVVNDATFAKIVRED